MHNQNPIRQYHNNNSYNLANTSNKTTYKSRKLLEIETIIGNELKGNMDEIRAYLKTPSQILQNLLDSLPSYYRTRETINKNDLLAEEILKNISLNIKTEKVKNIQSIEEPKYTEANTVIYEVLTTNVEIENECISAIIDTGASFSVISRGLAEKLNLAICHTEKINLTMANNHIIPSQGKCYNIPIKVFRNIYLCEAVVLDNPAHELLIGTNWLAK